MPHRQIQVHAVPGLWPPTWPMGLTMLRLLLLPVFLYVLLSDARNEAHPHRWVAVSIFAVMAITDKLDGYLARKLNQTTKLGTILDPVADKLLVACSVILLTFDWLAPQGFAIPWPVVVAIYGKDLVVALGTLSLLAMVGTVSITPRLLGKISTVVQLAMVMSIIISPDLMKLSPEFTTAFIPFLWWSAAIIAILSCVDYVIQGCLQFAAAKKRVGTADKRE